MYDAIDARDVLIDSQDIIETSEEIIIIVDSNHQIYFILIRSTVVIVNIRRVMSTEEV